MRSPLSLSNRYLWMGLIFLVLLGLLVFVAAPANNRLTSGSTYSRAPDGYGAWYAYLEAQGTPIQRWQQPISALIDQQAEANADPATLLQVLPKWVDPQEIFYTRPWLEDWLQQGNTLVVLGVRETATAAPFYTEQTSPQGIVEIATRRRNDAVAFNAEERLLGDAYGALVWQNSRDSGRLILAATPHLAANAYQQAAGNFAFLQQLVSPDGRPVWVDEYLHGYRDRQAVADASDQSWVSYLANTPLRIAFVQVVFLTLLGLYAGNRRPGVKQPVEPPAVNNSEAYIQALAGVLHRADSADFVVDTLRQAERVHLQRALGWGKAPLSDEQLATLWQTATEQPVESLQPLLASQLPRRERDLANWLSQLKQLRHIITTRTGHE